jgi:hypothetical protein
MYGRHARGCGISAHEMTNTTTKKAANSIVGKLTAGILAVAAVLTPAPAQAQGAASGPVLVVGDSLEVGAAPYLRQALAGTAVEIDARRGRSSTVGVDVLASKLRPEHTVVAFPLGTNDLSAATLAASLASAAELAGDRCVVVATIARPDRGSPTAELNQVVEQFASQSGAQVMDWRSAARSAPGVLGRDRIHATAQGYALRGSLLAEAIQACLVGGDLGGIPAPRDPDVRVPEPRRPKPPTPPARLPTPAGFAALAALLRHAGAPMSAALDGALTAATKAGPEPVLGAP